MKEKGITLVALMITIILLLILAGVALNLTLGEKGIFVTAKKAGENYTNASEKEIAELDNFFEELKQPKIPYEGKGYKFIYDGSLKSKGIEGQNMQNELTGGWSTARSSYSVDGVNYFWYNRFFIYK